jgi:aspartyl-tRNA(Asn)/glutamyl-tRNA(Gln) amidotransferase subunit A
MAALHELSAAELAAQYASRKVSPVDVARACLERIDACEGRLNAMYRVDREGAAAAARAAEERWRAGRPLSAARRRTGHDQGKHLHARGPGADRHARKRRCTCTAGRRASFARAREAGCVILGKTTMPDYGMLSSGLSSIHGITRNPWRLDRNTSGSSSGAGAAAAAGYGPLHIGTDIGGSVRLPATHCGLFALKPSLGRIPIYPPYIGRVAGPMTRTVRDGALLLNALAKPDARDFMSLPDDRTDYAGELERFDVKKLRIGFLADMKGRVARRRRGRGGRTCCGKGTLRGGCEGRGNDVVSDAGAARRHGALFRSALVQRLRPVACGKAGQGAAVHHRMVHVAREGVQWPGRVHGVQHLRRAAGKNHRGHAGVRLRAFAHVTDPSLRSRARLSRQRPAQRAAAHCVYRSLQHVEQPAASLNWTFSADGLPIGVQVIGRRFDDLGVLKLASVLEKIRPPQKAWPELMPSSADAGAARAAKDMPHRH